MKWVKHRQQCKQLWFLKIMSVPVRLAYQVFGSKSAHTSPVLILHGLFGSSNNWRTLGRRIASEMRTIVYALDARNHGNSDHVTHMDYALMSRDTMQFCKEHQLDRVSLIGHSMGGKTAMLLALDHPQLVDRLVVGDVSPTPAPGVGETEDLVETLRSLDLSSISNRREADAAVQSSIPDQATRDFLLTSLVRSPGGHMMWRFNLDGIARSMRTLKDFPTKTGCFEGRALFVGGERSNYITTATSPKIIRLFPNASIAHIPRAGHWLHTEKPKEFLAAVTDFLTHQ